MMTECFDDDLYPGRPRVLFIGFPESSHTHSWINLLEGEQFNVRLFALPSAEPPVNWPVKTYLTCAGSQYHDNATRRTIFPPPDSSLSGVVNLANQAMAKGLFSKQVWLRNQTQRCLSVVERLRSNTKYPVTIEEALSRVIQSWRPDVIHTLGFDSASYFYLRTRKQFSLEHIGRWVAQARGGPDLALQRFSPDFKPLIEEALKTCDHFIADNEPNYNYALSAGATISKIQAPGMGVVSGAGGMDVDHLREMWTLLPSRRERVIVWPKAYETYTAKAMPVFEAILKVWDQIQPCRIEMLWMVQSDVKIWYEKLFPADVKQSCQVFGRLERDETLGRISNARVLLAPSLSDGIPNTMMEAMALGAAPLVSPLDTICPVVKEEENVLFARNLYPNEIAEKLVRLMSDDRLVDCMAENNVTRVREMADRNKVREKALEFYECVAALSRKNKV
tara:strand:- start:157965 stop:159311 length:1347 start_codon:yes stop_codon:yes gene_type:complete